MRKNEKSEDRYWLKKSNRLFLWKGIYTIIVALMLVGMAWLLKSRFNRKFLEVFNVVGSILIAWAGTTLLVIAVLDLMASMSNYFRGLLQKIAQIDWVRIDLTVFLVWGMILIICVWS